MNLSDIVSLKNIILNFHAEDNEEAIKKLVDKLFTINTLDHNFYEDALAKFIERERGISTAVGNGVAIPHIMHECVSNVTGMFALCPNGIDFFATDSQMVRVIILFAVPHEKYNLHLKTLAAIGRIFANVKVVEELMQADDKEEIRRVIAKAENTKLQFSRKKPRNKFQKRSTPEKISG